MTKLHARFSIVSLALLLAVLTGCAPPIVKQGPGINFTPTEVKKYAEDQEQVLAQLYALAGVTAKPPASNDWDKVIRAGMDYADQKCEAYMHALFRLNRDKNTAIAEIGLVGTAVAGVAAAVKAKAKEIAILAVAFGLASATVDNLSSNLLYELEPSSVRSLVKGLQEGYRTNLPSGYDSKPAAVTAIRRYTELCLPANIEAEVNLAVKKSVPETKPGNATTGEPPTSTHSEVVARLESAYQFDDASQKLRNYWQPGGKVSPANEKAIRDWMAKNKLAGESLAFFIRSQKYEKERAQAVTDLKL
jgi:hypothetical protein